MIEITTPATSERQRREAERAQPAARRPQGEERAAECLDAPCGRPAAIQRTMKRMNA